MLRFQDFDCYLLSTPSLKPLSIDDAGPNPMFHGKYAKSIVGITKFHWFEGDGMLHATYIEKRGDEYHLSYKNKFVEAAGYLVDKEAGKPLVLQTMEGSPWGLLINGLLNQVSRRIRLH